MYVVTRIGREEIECVDADGRKYYYPLEQTPLVEIGDRVSGHSGPSWNLLTNVVIEPPTLLVPPEKIELPRCDQPDLSLDPLSGSFALVDLNDVAQVIKIFAARISTLESILKSHLSGHAPIYGGSSRLRP